MKLQTVAIARFQETVWDQYRAATRSMPWRTNPEPYRVLVSELMLQQTQVGRVTPKFLAFMERFPEVHDLAGAPLAEVLGLWSGLGYNRRAKFLQQAARAVVEQFGGRIPQTLAELVQLPGVGKNTAGAILAYGYNQPVLFIETNIRTVYFHHFFSDRQDVDDKELLPLLEQTLDREHPREWYWALMDYGAYLKQTNGNNIQRSKHYTKQSTFHGSYRQLRGQVLKYLLQTPVPFKELTLAIPDERLASVVGVLQNEGLVLERNGLLMVPR